MLSEAKQEALIALLAAHVAYCRCWLDFVPEQVEAVRLQGIEALRQGVQTHHDLTLKAIALEGERVQLMQDCQRELCLTVTPLKLAALFSALDASRQRQANSLLDVLKELRSEIQATHQRQLALVLALEKTLAAGLAFHRGYSSGAGATGNFGSTARPEYGILNARV